MRDELQMLRDKSNELEIKASRLHPCVRLAPVCGLPDPCAACLADCAPGWLATSSAGAGRRCGSVGLE